MVTSTKELFPYDSLDKYTESLVQCPICHYYLKINPQTDSMKFKLIAKDIIHFLTIHQFNSSFHSVIIEYCNFSFSKVIDYSDSKDQKSSDVFPLYHLVDLSEYTTFRDRVLELESNNNDLISSFKAKLDSLESSYKQTELDNKSLSQKLLELTDLKTDFENVLSDTMILLDTTKSIVSEQSEEKRDLHKKINLLEREKYLVEEHDAENNLPKNELPSDSIRDSKIKELLDIERHQKREAVHEKKNLEQKVIELESKLSNLSTTIPVQSDSEQVRHELTIKFEKQLSDLTLQLQDRDEQIQFLNQSLASKKSDKEISEDSISKSSHFDRNYRLQINELFLDVQKLFNSLQFDLFLSLYNIEHFNGQLRNAFEQFFAFLIQKATSIGQVLLNDPDFSLFKELHELNPRLKFSEEQQIASIQLQSLQFVLKDALKHIFSIIKAIKSYYEEDNYVIIPDDIQISVMIQSTFHDNKISFFIPLTDETKFSNLGHSIRVFRPVSELFKDAFILITMENDTSLNNNTYRLIPFSFEISDSKAVLEIDNFFSESDSFQLGSFFDDQFFVIQKINFNSGLDSLKESIFTIINRNDS